MSAALVALAIQSEGGKARSLLGHQVKITTDDAFTKARIKTIEGSKMEDEAKWISDGMNVDVTFWNGRPIGISIPNSVVLQIVTSEPGIKGDTASGATKPATLSTGAVINVPLFVNEGEWVKVDTREGTYIERVNKR